MREPTANLFLIQNATGTYHQALGSEMVSERREKKDNVGNFGINYKDKLREEETILKKEEEEEEVF